MQCELLTFLHTREEFARVKVMVRVFIVTKQTAYLAQLLHSSHAQSPGNGELMREHEQPTALNRHQFLFQVLLQRMLRTNAIELRTNAIENEAKLEEFVGFMREEKEEPVDIAQQEVDVARQEKKLKRMRARWRRVRDALFEACCSFQRDCTSVPIERLSILANRLKLLEHRTDGLKEELKKFPLGPATLRSLGFSLEEPTETGD